MCLGILRLHIKCIETLVLQFKMCRAHKEKHLSFLLSVTFTCTIHYPSYTRKGKEKKTELRQLNLIVTYFCQLFIRILGSRSISLPPNEPPTNLERNSVDLKELKAEIKRLESETVEIPCIVGGKEIYTGNTGYQVAVSQLY